MTDTTFPTQSGPLTLVGPAGTLQLAIDLPEADVAPQPVVAIVCHPLPTEGGTMDNKVVTMAARALRELGVATVRFNFRGTGGSQGTFDHGDGERGDLQAVADWVRRTRPDAALWLVGFSFGAYVSIRSAQALQPALLISIAPPAGRWDFPAIDTPTMPWIVIQGEADEIVDPQAVYAWLDALGRDVDLIKMPETSHFFHGKLMPLREAIQQHAAPHLPADATHD